MQPICRIWLNHAFLWIKVFSELRYIFSYYFKNIMIFGKSQFSVHYQCLIDMQLDLTILLDKRTDIRIRHISLHTFHLLRKDSNQDRLWNLLKFINMSKYCRNSISPNIRNGTLENSLLQVHNIMFNRWLVSLIYSYKPNRYCIIVTQFLSYLASKIILAIFLKATIYC